MYIKNNCIDMICFYAFWILILNLKSGIKQPTISWKFAEESLPKAKTLGPTDDKQPDFSKKALILAAILLHQSY